MNNTMKATAFNSQYSKGLRLMIQAYDYADELGRDVWDFAVEVTALKDIGFSYNFIRWLVCKGYAELAREITAPDDSTRSFQRQHQDNLVLRKRTCVVLTDSGIACARQLVVELEKENNLVLRRGGHPLRLMDGAAGRDGGNGRDRYNGHGRDNVRDRDSVNGRDGGNANGYRTNGEQDKPARAAFDCKPTPTWDSDRQELRFGGRVVKEFKLYSPNQAIILAAFEEEGWPTKIDDPLPHHPDIVPKQRLHDTIKSLNRNQKCPLIRFRGDGTGQGIRWELRRAAPQELPLNGSQTSVI